MASNTYAVQQAKHANVAASPDLDTITLAGCYAGIIRVRNRATSGDPLYFRVYVDGTNTTQTAPTVAGDDTYVVPFGDLCDVGWPGGDCVVKVISASARDYSVESLPGMI